MARIPAMFLRLPIVRQLIPRYSASRRSQLQSPALLAAISHPNRLAIL
jgi:hypothetical protein